MKALTQDTVPEQIFVDSKITQHWDTLQCSLLPLMLHFLSPSAVPIQLPVGHEIHSNDSNSKKKNEAFLFLTELFSVIWFSTQSGERWHCIAAELEMNGWEWAETD